VAEPPAASPVEATPAAAPVKSAEPVATPAQPDPREAPVMLARERRIQSLDSMVGRQIAPAPASPGEPSSRPDTARRGSVVYEGEPAAGAGQTRSGRVIYEGEPPSDQPSPAPVQQAPAPAASATRLPSFQDLQLRGELSLAPMHLDIHVYSDNPSERFVFINMRKYKEGDKTSEGPVVERIDTAGAVLGHQGRRFLLPRD
jgi:general secretion pathway protein B